MKVLVDWVRALAVVVVFVITSLSVGFTFADEVVYMKAGLGQLSGTPPALTSNPEHPPLAKYLIGLAPRWAPFIAGVVTVFLTGWLGRLLGRPFWLVSLSLATDIIFARTSSFAMLDVFVALFSVSAVISYLLGRRWLSGVLWGAALASKFTAAFPLAGFVFYVLLRDRKSLAPITIGAAVAFLAAHAVDLAHGLFLYHLQFYWWLVSFHSHKNPLTGWLTFLMGAPWYVYYTKFLYNGTDTVTALSNPGVYKVLEYEIQVSIAPWLGHVAWRAVPVELIRKPSLGLDALLVASSVLISQSGWFYWYFAAVAPFFHLYTRRIYVAIQLIFIALLYLGMPPILTWPLGPFKTG
ncbi:hypothetical protein [Pyrobaculum ferrireducens]|nr:hypothetical protein [Pyrobaculum ferrireducens]